MTFTEQTKSIAASTGASPANVEAFIQAAMREDNREAARREASQWERTYLRVSMGLVEGCGDREAAFALAGFRVWTERAQGTLW